MEERRTAGFTEWGGEELEYFVEQLENMHGWGPGIERHTPPNAAQSAMMENMVDSYWSWWKSTILEAAEALVVVRRRELEKAEVVLQEVGLVLGLVASEG